MKLGQVSQRLACHYAGITTTLSESLFDALDRGSPAAGCTGARNADSLLNQQILPALSQQLLSHGGGQKPRQVTLGYHEEEGVVDGVWTRGQYPMSSVKSLFSHNHHLLSVKGCEAA